MKDLLNFKIIVPVLIAMVVFTMVIAPMMKKSNGNGTVSGNGNGNGNGGG